MGATGLLTRAKQLQQSNQDILQQTETPHRPLRYYDEHVVDLERAFLTLLSAFRSAVRVNALEKVFSMMHSQTHIYTNHQLHKYNIPQLNKTITKKTLAEFIYRYARILQ